MKADSCIIHSNYSSKLGHVIHFEHRMQPGQLHTYTKIWLQHIQHNMTGEIYIVWQEHEDKAFLWKAKKHLSQAIISLSRAFKVVTGLHAAFISTD